MLCFLCIYVGSFFLVSLSVWLWFMIFRPAEWAHFIEEKSEIWAKRGESVGWASAGEDSEQGKGLKAAVATSILLAAIFTFISLVLWLATK